MSIFRTMYVDQFRVMVEIYICRLEKKMLHIRTSFNRTCEKEEMTHCRNNIGLELKQELIPRMHFIRLWYLILYKVIMWHGFIRVPVL